MCYSVKSSLKTTLFSLFAIIYLLTTNIPHFQWIGITLIGWCGMQFDELLLWLTEPRKGCNIWNKLITMTLIPLVLMLQPLGSLFGSFYVIPWNKSSDFRKNFTIYYSIFIILAVSFAHLYKPEKICTTVTKEGHLYWHTSKNWIKTKNIDTYFSKFIYFLWAFLIILPICIFWNKSYLLPLLIVVIPTFGFFTGLTTDSRASIWCHYTSYTSIIASIALLLQQTGIYKFV
jgi:hypothetical protein